MKTMVFDVGGTEIKYSLIDEQLQPTHSGAVPTPMDTQEHFLDICYDIYSQYKNDVDGIAMSLPGFIDPERGMVLGGGALLYNIGTPVGKSLAERCGCPVWLENDGKGAAIAELWRGALKGCKNAAVFIIGTGVGGGLIIDGKLVRGKHGTAGEFSFVNTNSDAWADPQCVMALQCSTRALLTRYRTHKQLPQDYPLDGRTFFAAANGGEAEALATLHEFGRAVAIQIYNLNVLLDLEKVAIGGGISRQPLLIDTINEEYTRMINEHPFGKLVVGMLPRPEIVACRFGNEANQLGALYSYLQAKEQGRLLK